MAGHGDRPTGAELLRRVQAHPASISAVRRSPGSTPRRSDPSSRASTAATSSTGTRTAWRSASAASCAPGLPGRLHLRPRTRQPARPPGVAGRAVRLRLRDQYLRCIHCDLCVEACPTEAITESKLMEFSFTNRGDAIYTKASCWSTTTVGRSTCPGRTGARGTTCTRRAGCGPRRRRAAPSSRARSSGRASSASVCGRPSAAHSGAATTRAPAAWRSGTPSSAPASG